MAKIMKFSGLALAAIVSATTLLPAGAAFAGHRQYYSGGYNDGALIAGVAGVILGAAIGAPFYGTYYEPEPQVIYVEPGPYYGEPYPVYAEPELVYAEPEPYIAKTPRRTKNRDGYKKHNPGPRVVTYDESIGSGDDSYGASHEPWTEAWVDRCRSKFRSFDARTGTYKGYDGLRHFCVIR